MRIYVRTRGYSHELDYRFLGPAPEEPWWWGAYTSVTRIESSTILLECDGPSWRCYIAGISSQRRDPDGRPIQVDLVLDGEGGPSDVEDQQIALAIIDASIDGLAGLTGSSSSTELIPGDLLDDRLGERAVEEMARALDKTAAADAATAVRDAYRGVRRTPRPAPIPAIRRWLGGLASSGSRDEFVDLARQLLSGRAGRALMLNGIADYADIKRIPATEPDADLGILVCRAGPLFSTEVRGLDRLEPASGPRLSWLRQRRTGSPAAGDDADARQKRRARRLTIARRVLAGLLVTTWIAVTWISYQTPYLQSCQDEVARVGTVALARSCGPLGLTDAPLLVLIGAAVLLLLPDVSSIEIPGILRLERRIEAQGKRQEEIAEEIKNLVLNQSQSQAQAQASDQRMKVTVNTNFPAQNLGATGGAEVGRLVYRLPEREPFDAVATNAAEVTQVVSHSQEGGLR